MSGIANPFGSRFHQQQTGRSVPLGGVPQISDSLALALSEEDVRPLSKDQYDELRASIRVAKAELRRRHLAYLTCE